MNIVLYPDDPLQGVAAPVEHFGPRLENLALRMLDVMYEHEGVAACGSPSGHPRSAFSCAMTSNPTRCAS